ncbi:unnamed protein product [Rotaria magnacalcarata]|uniref:Cadherin domain-containing protein n=1 Tax=Rotaria magnacalcarata TaxID=392030 RepID=A0A815MNZ2_9BILA|nr:unnamed protein product [Rotaria magnacalcarata]
MLFIIIFLNIFLRISSHEVLKYIIDEKLPVNTLISDLSKELNIKSNGFFQIYELSPLNKNLFTIHNQTGHLTIRSILNREQMCLKRQCSCSSCEIILQLLIKIQDKIIYKIIEIKIKDLNDHSPLFDKQSMIHVIHIKENVPLGYRIILPSANDPDEGMNSVQAYRLDGPNSEDFDVDFSTFDIPYLIVRSSLDSQRLSSYSLLLTTSDHGEPPRATSIQLNITVLNINDSIPIFVQSIYSIDIREDTVIGTTILKIEAINDNNEKIFYELLTESPFIIDRLTGRIQLSKTLDYEREKSYRLIVKAYENLIPTYASIFIRIIDINDNPVSMQIKVEGDITIKQKQNDKTVLFLQEDTPLGTTIAHVILNDLDSSANGNPYLQLRTTEPPLPLIYKLIYQNSFHNTKLYSLILNQNLNRESKSIYNNIQLISHDSGTPTLHTKLHLILDIIDVNDCIPTIQKHSTVYDINENNPVGYIIDKLIAYDCDLGENAEIEYHLLNETDLLTLNTKTGEISLKQSIDFDLLNRQQEKYLTTINLEFYIKVQDHGKPSLSSQTKIILRIHDLNDHSPEFAKNQSYDWTYSQSSLQSGSVLGRVHAYDNDSGLQGLINYSIRSFHPCLTLDITSLGYVYIPYESSILTCSLLSYTFEITASDYDPINSRSTTQLLIVNIQSKSSNNNKILPKLLTLSTQRTKLDINTQGNAAFILDITTFNNHTYQPVVYLNNTNLLSCWNVTSTGEVSLISNPFASSYILSLNIIDQYAKENSSIKLQIDICNSSILYSCQSYYFSDNRTILIYAVCLALVITSICIIIFSLIICLCCGRNKHKNETLSSTHQNTFLQCNDDYHSEKTEISNDRRKSSSNSTIREDDHDSACIINGHSSSSNSSSSGIMTKNDAWYNQKEPTIQMYPSASTYYYDLKLAELLRKNQNPPCIHLNELPTIPQSSSTDYGFSSLELSTSSSTSTIPNHHIEIGIDQSPETQFNMTSFISSRECVV